MKSLPIFLDNITEKFFKASISKESYELIKGDVDESNRQNVATFSGLAATGFFLLAIFGNLLQGRVHTLRGFYFVGFFIFLILSLTGGYFGKKNRLVLYLSIYGFVAVFLILGIVLGVFLNSDQQTTSFIVFIIAIPLMFTFRPRYINAVILFFNGVYLFLIHIFQSGTLFEANAINAATYGLLSLLVGTYTMNIKFERFLSNYANKMLMETDQLTGLYNRLSYENDLQHIMDNNIECSVAVFDVNGLKERNDFSGHAAGDELICGAAKCIYECFSKYGKCYRIGGDEFVAILTNVYDTEASIQKTFTDIINKWSGEYSKELSISFGMVSSKEFPHKNIKELIATADKLMYSYKSEYYQKAGKDRRGKI